MWAIYRAGYYLVVVSSHVPSSNSIHADKGPVAWMIVPGIHLSSPGIVSIIHWVTDFHAAHPAMLIVLLLLP